jgi:ribosomal protein S21
VRFSLTNPRCALPTHGIPARILSFELISVSPASRQPSRRRRMGVQIEVEEGEPIKDVLSRFRKAVQADGAYPFYHCKWHKKRRDFYIKPSVLNRRRRWIDRVRKKRCGRYGPDPDYWWADDLLMRPRRAYGPTGRYVAT